MSSQRLQEIKGQKYFYRDQFRGAVKILQYSLVLTIILTVSIAYLEFTKQAPKYYASNASGAGFITQLTARDQPNESSEALLAPDRPAEMGKNKLTIQ